MTGRSRFARAARLCVVLAAPLLALAAAPAAAQLTVSITSTPLNGQYYVAGEKITTRISGLPANMSPDTSQFTSVVSDCVTRNPDSPGTRNWRCNWMRIDVGGVTREARITIDPNNQTAIDYEYTVQAADTDTDGVSIPANLIVGRDWRNGRNSIYDPIVNRNHAALAAQSAHKVDGSGAPIRFSINAPRVVEGGAGDTPTMTYTVTLSSAASVQATVNYNDWSGGTATSGTDYTAVTAGMLTFAAGETSQTVSVTVTGDTTAESDETIDLQLSNPTPTGIVVVSGMEVGRGTIVDDDTPTLTIDSPRALEGTNLDYTVTLSPAVPSGHSVTVNGDATAETDETVLLQLSNPSPSGFVIATGMGTGLGTIVDDDTPTLTINSPRVAEGNSGTTELVFTVTLSPADTAQVTVDWSESVGTATAGTDYTALSGGTLTFAAGETSKTIPVEVRGDSAVEPDETVRVAIANPVPSGRLIRNADGERATHAFGVGTITNDDAPPAPPPSTEKLVLSTTELEVATGAEGASAP